MILLSQYYTVQQRRKTVPSSAHVSLPCSPCIETLPPGFVVVYSVETGTLWPWLIGLLYRSLFLWNNSWLPWSPLSAHQPWCELNSSRPPQYGGCLSRLKMDNCWASFLSKPVSFNWNTSCSLSAALFFRLWSYIKGVLTWLNTEEFQINPEAYDSLVSSGGLDIFTAS